MSITNRVIKGITQLEKMDRPYIIGIDGLSGAGKTTITEKIKEELMSEEYNVVIIHIDDLIVERAKRYNTGYPEWYEYYMLQWDVEYIKENLFEAVHQKLNHIDIKFYESANDRCHSKNIDLEKCTLILIEGIFLQRKEWRAFFDYVIYLDCPKDIRYDRVLQRDTYLGDMKERLEKYERRYWMGEDYYLQEENPIQNSDIVINSL
ncbi:kinase [Psychrobacillus vulpis]|uniref:Uridine kinase n=1 Tax=Psychrobacillus vulpis TaxID=2325572 RepID=A0A544TW68_9BACI|nr:kinase [Psychrobacillus vulpis]TQR21693.1 uridine kinase [Psychrobacillus vulpis]